MVPFASPLDEAERRRHRLRNVLHAWLLILGSGALVALIAWTEFAATALPLRAPRFHWQRLGTWY